MKQLKLYRQGDVLIREISQLPEKIRPVQSTDRYILAEGEATGHHHSIQATDGLSVFQQKSGELVMQVEEKSVSLKHQEHAPIEIPLGIYEVKRQREYQPQGEAHYVYD